MDPFICTHIIYSFGWMKKNKLVAHDLEADETRNGKKGGYERIVDLKKINPKLKVSNLQLQQATSMMVVKKNSSAKAIIGKHVILQANVNKFSNSKSSKRFVMDLLSEFSIAETISFVESNFLSHQLTKLANIKRLPRR